jgi:GNAT superfamily N-acetyltransferase
VCSTKLWSSLTVSPANCTTTRPRPLILLPSRSIVGLMPFIDLALSRSLERVEGEACRAFAHARRRLDPASGAASIECAGTYAVFDGTSSPITQTFGLGLFEEATPAALDQIERFFTERGARTHHEVSPLSGVATTGRLCARGYRPIEMSSVMFRGVGASGDDGRGIVVRVAGGAEAALWADLNVRGWAHGHPELTEFLQEAGALMTAREQNVCFIAEWDGQPGAAGALFVHDGVALFAGATTAPEYRNRGLQSALLHARMQYAHEHDCDLAMMVAEVGSQSQRNAERAGFHIAYTRTKWELRPTASA